MRNWVTVPAPVLSSLGIGFAVAVPKDEVPNDEASKNTVATTSDADVRNSIEPLSISVVDASTTVLRTKS